MPPKNFCRKSEAVGEIPRFFPIKPVNVLVAAQPCKLTLGILARAELDLFDGLLACGRAVKVGKRFLVADGLHGRHIARQPGSGQSPESEQK